MITITDVIHPDANNKMLAFKYDVIKMNSIIKLKGMHIIRIHNFKISFQSKRKDMCRI